MDNYGKMFEELPKGSISEQIIERITDAIIRGELKPGDKIPTEVEFSENLGVGRNTVREATKILVAFGVLEIRRSEGTFVVKNFNNKMLDSMVYGVLLAGKGMEELLELKISILRSILYLAIKKADENDIKILSEKQKNMEEAVEKYSDDIEKLYTANQDFHRCLAEICHNPIVNELNNIILKMSKYSRLKGLETSIKNNSLNKVSETTNNLLNVVKSRDINKIDDVVNNVYKLWNEIVL